jgi:hypothetical protein
MAGNLSAPEERRSIAVLLGRERQPKAELDTSLHPERHPRLKRCSMVDRVREVPTHGLITTRQDRSIEPSLDFGIGSYERLRDGIPISEFHAASVRQAPMGCQRRRSPRRATYLGLAPDDPGTVFRLPAKELIALVPSFNRCERRDPLRGAVAPKSRRSFALCPTATFISSVLLPSYCLQLLRQVQGHCRWRGKRATRVGSCGRV